MVRNHHSDWTPDTPLSGPLLVSRQVQMAAAAGLLAAWLGDSFWSRIAVRWSRL